MAPRSMNFPAPNVHRAEVEKHWFRSDSRVVEQVPGASRLSLTAHAPPAVTGTGPWPSLSLSLLIKKMGTASFILRDIWGWNKVTNVEMLSRIYNCLKL